MSTSERRSRFHEWVILSVFCAFFFFYGLSGFGLVGADEPRYAQVAREMLTRHDWVTPTLYGHVWLEKPVLYYWSAMVSYSVLGISDWSARIPVGLMAALMVAALYLFMRRFRAGVHLYAALIACSTAGILSFARAGSTDMPLAACFTIGLLAWLTWYQTHEKKWLLVSYFLMAAGMLAKGPVAPLLAGLIILCFALLTRNFRVVRDTFWIPGILVFTLTAMPWYLLVQLRNPQFFSEFIVRQNLARFGTNLYQHERPFWYFIPVMLVGLIPWTVLGLAACLRAIRGWMRPAADGAGSPDDLEKFLAIWALLPVVFFSFSQSKLPGYIIPSIPAWVILTALYFVHQSAARKRSVWIAQALVLALCIGLTLLAPWLLLYPHAMPPVSVWRGPVIITALMAPVLIGFAIWRGWKAVSVSTLCVAVITAGLLLKTAAPVIDSTQSARPVALHLANSNLPVAVFHVPRAIQYGLGFYLNHEIPSYDAGNFPRQEHFLLTQKGDLKNLVQLLHDQSSQAPLQCERDRGLQPDVSFHSPLFDLYRVSASPPCDPGAAIAGVGAEGK